MSFINTTRDLFEQLSDRCLGSLENGETLTLRLGAEDQHYVRFNNGRVRQSTEVQQRHLSLSFQTHSRRRVAYTLDLTGCVPMDVATTLSLLDRARQETSVLPEDPFAPDIVDHGSSDQHHPGSIPDFEELLNEISGSAQDCEFTGLYAGGPQLEMIRNSEGMSHVFSCESFFLDYSLFTRNMEGENKAVKALYANREWDALEFRKGLTENRQRLALLEQKSHALEPGHYRVFFAPDAVNTLLAMFSWGGLSYGSWKKGDSALSRLIEGEACLSPLLNLSENFNLGLAPRFNSLGELAAETMSVIRSGQVENLLISSRSAREFGVPTNYASPREGLRSPQMETGTLDDSKALEALDTGIYVSNLHYLNWSDQHNARVTGMTRYACFFIEKGHIVAPIRDMRFDESLYRVLGSELEAITASSQLIAETDTYGQRSLSGSQVPGILVRDFRFTL